MNLILNTLICRLNLRNKTKCAGSLPPSPQKKHKWYLIYQEMTDNSASYDFFSNMFKL